MFLSVFDIFKVGIGPSSSHTMGPMAAALRFVTDDVRQLSLMPARFSVTLHGSLVFTGKGHGTDRAIALGLLGYTPQNIDVERVDDLLDALNRNRSLEGPAAGMRFDPANDIHFDYVSLSETSSGWRLTENRAMLSCDEGSLQAHWLDGVDLFRSRAALGAEIWTLRQQ